MNQKNIDFYKQDFIFPYNLVEPRTRISEFLFKIFVIFVSSILNIFEFSNFSEFQDFPII